MPIGVIYIMIDQLGSCASNLPLSDYVYLLIFTSLKSKKLCMFVSMKYCGLCFVTVFTCENSRQVTIQTRNHLSNLFKKCLQGGCDFLVDLSWICARKLYIIFTKKYAESFLGLGG